jgi:hypothetical protein
MGFGPHSELMYPVVCEGFSTGSESGNFLEISPIRTSSFDLFSSRVKFFLNSFVVIRRKA